MPRLTHIVERFLLLWLILLSLLAYGFSTWFPGAWDPFVASKPPRLHYLFAVTMLAIGSMLPREEIRQVFRRWPTVLGGTAIQYTSMPLFAWCLARGLSLDGAARTGLIMVGCVPGAMASNVLTLTARGNVSYSVSLTTSATLLSPLAVPVALRLALGRSVDFPAGRVCWELCWMVVVPVVVGHLLSRSSARWEALARRFGSLVANLSILWIIAVVVALKRSELSQLEIRLFWGLLTLNVLGYLAGLGGGVLLRLSGRMRRALTLEIGMQNAGLGTVLALGLFQEDATAIAPAIYTFGCMLTGTILARAWAELGKPENADGASEAGPTPAGPAERH